MTKISERIDQLDQFNMKINSEDITAQEIEQFYPGIRKKEIFRNIFGPIGYIAKLSDFPNNNQKKLFKDYIINQSMKEIDSLTR